MAGPPWSKADNDKFREMALAGSKPAELAAYFNRSISAIHGRAKRHGINMTASPKKPHWTPEQIDAVKAFYETGSRVELERVLPGRSWRSIVHKGRRSQKVRASVTHRLADRTIGQLEPVVAAYIAGFVDGEGTITVGIGANARAGNYTDPRVVPMITMANTHAGVIQWLLAQLPGARQASPEQTMPGNKRCHHVRITKLLDIQSLLRQLLPYLIVKREQAKLMLEYCDIRLGDTWMVYSPRLFDLIKAMRQLNARGDPTVPGKPLPVGAAPPPSSPAPA